MTIQRKFSKLPLKNSQLYKGDNKSLRHIEETKSIVKKVLVSDMNASDDMGSILVSEDALA